MTPSADAGEASTSPAASASRTYLFGALSMSPNRKVVYFGVALLAIAFAGCGPKTVKVNGKVLKNGQPMIVPETTYVTISFIPDGPADEKKGAPSPHSATFDQKTGTYSVQLPPGKYRTMIVVALPSKNDGKLNAPKPAQDAKVYEITKDQELDLNLSGS